MKELAYLDANANRVSGAQFTWLSVNPQCVRTR